MEPVKQGKALTEQISWIYLLRVPKKSLWDSKFRGHDERLGGHGTQFPYLWKRLQTMIKRETKSNNTQKTVHNSSYLRAVSIPDVLQGFILHVWDKGNWKFLNHHQQTVTQQDTKHNGGICTTSVSPFTEVEGEGRHRLGWIVWTANRTETLSKVFRIQHRKQNFLPKADLLRSIYGASLTTLILPPWSYWGECKCVQAPLR